MVQKKDINSEIILNLLKNDMHLREISRVLSVPHATISRKLNFLLKEGILDFTFKGRNKIFFIKNNLQARTYIYNAERYKLTQLLEKYPKLGVILNEVIKETQGLTILFGSYAKFCAEKDSDIDIYIETLDKQIKSKIESINSKISVKIGKFDKDNLLIKEIIKEHVLLKGGELFYEKIFD
jgi:predicted nucleotidyltransferase/predicted DNA-binding transcriptional regulator